MVHVTGPVLSSLSSACPLQRVNICSSFGPCDIASLLCSFSQRRWMSVGLPIRSNSTLISDQRWIAFCVIPLIPVTVFCQFETTTDSHMSCKRQHPIPDGGEWISMIWVFYTTKSVPFSIPMRLLWSLVLNDKWCRFRKNGFFSSSSFRCSNLRDMDSAMLPSAMYAQSITVRWFAHTPQMNLNVVDVRLFKDIWMDGMYCF